MHGQDIKEEDVVMVRKLKASEKFGYMFSGVAYCFCQLIPAFLLFYATESLVLSIASVSLMVALVKILDAFTDFIAGIIIDKTNAKSGKARPWFLRVAIPYAIFLVLLFSIPSSLGTTAKLLLLAVFYALTVSVFGTMIGVARYAIVPRMTRNAKEQGQLGILGDGIGATLMGLGMAMTFVLVSKIGWTGTFGLYAVIALVACLLCYVLTREYTEEIDAVIYEKKLEKRGAAKEFFTVIFGNKYAMLLFLIVFVQQLGAIAIASTGTYYYSYIVGDLNYFNKAMGIATILSAVGMIIGTFLIKKIGPKNLGVLGCIGTVICYITMTTVGVNNITILIIAFAVAMMFGMTFVCSIYAPFAAGAVEYGEKLNGIRKEGLVSSVLNVAFKVGSATGTALIGLIMAAGGYMEGGVEQSVSALNSIRFVYLFLPMILFVILCLIIAFAYRLDRDLAKLQAK